MSHVLLERYEQIMMTLSALQQERLLHAQALTSPQKRGERIQHALAFVTLELQCHKEVRTLWPYVLSVSTEPQVQVLFQKYNCHPEELGDILDQKITSLGHTIEAIEAKMIEDNHSGFWQDILEQWLDKITAQAHLIKSSLNWE